LANAVPDVQTKTLGIPEALACPNAKNEADLSSTAIVLLIPGCAENAKVRGVDLDPGEITTL